MPKETHTGEPIENYTKSAMLPVESKRELDSTKKDLMAGQMDYSRTGLDSFSNILAISKELSREPKETGLRELEEMGLPRQQRIQVGAADFLENPQGIYNQMQSEKYYIILPSVDGKRRREINLSPESAREYVKNGIHPNERSDAKISVIEYFDNIWGGNIRIQKNGLIEMEMAPGGHAEMVSGSRTPTVRIVREPGEISFRGYQAIKPEDKKYEGDDPLEKVNLWEPMKDQALMMFMIEQFIMKIPKDEESDNASPQTINHRTGYYEVVAVKKKGKDGLYPQFLDYKSSSVWTE